MRAKTCLAIFSTVLVVSGCSPTNSQLVSQLQDQDPAIRARAIREIARSERTELLDNLLDRLEDEDAAVRFCAMSALQELTDSSHDYDYWASTSERAKAAQAWRESIAD